MSVAENIAAVVADLRGGRFQSCVPADHVAHPLAIEAAAWSGYGPAVDASALYASLVGRGEVKPYDDFACAAPPWEQAVIGWGVEEGPVGCLSMYGNELADLQDDPELAASWDIDWDPVRWLVTCVGWAGGRALGGGRMPTVGPVCMARLAVDGDGRLIDMHQVDLHPTMPPGSSVEMCGVLLAALDFMHCTNVDIAVPDRPRAQARRLARTGVTVSTISVFPTRRGRGSGNRTDAGVPLHSVRGKFHHYGACCPDHPPHGLLFGRYEGRVWKPAHARGSATLGERRSNYRLRPDG